MNPKFERFLKETKQDQLKKERLERKAQREADKIAKLAQKEEAKRLKALAKEEKKRLKEEEARLKKEARLLAKGTKKKSPKLDSSAQEDLFSSTSTSNPLEEHKELRSEGDLESTEDGTSTPVTPVTAVTGLDGTPAQESTQFLCKEEAPKVEEATNSNNLIENKIDPNEPKSLYEMFKSEGDFKWLQSDCPATKAAFNLINKSLHPERPLARGVAVLAIKGSSFDDKRTNCLTTLSNIQARESSGEIELVPEPTNPFDSNALAIYNKESNQMLGYVPKTQEINACYTKSLQEGKFCGGYIIDGKKGMLKGEENAMLLIATGWI
jgi:hypothetical protein